jgi:hypothetical protein
MRYLLRVTTDLDHTNADAAGARLVDLRRRTERKSPPCGCVAYQPSTIAATPSPAGSAAPAGLSAGV